MLRKIKTNDLSVFINKYSLKRGVEASDACQTAQDVLSKVFGINRGSFSVSSFKNGILYIKAANSILLQELKFRENQIKDLILDKSPEIRLDKITGRVA